MFKKTLSSSMLILGLTASATVMAEQKIAVISSFSILGDLVSEVGKEHVSVQNLVKAGGDAHVFNPTPQDAKAISKAQLVVINGLQFEGWMPRLIQAANYKGVQVIATHGIDTISSKEDEHHDEHDDHKDEHKHHDDHDDHKDEHAHHDDHDDHKDEHAHHDDHDDHKDEHAHHDDHDDHKDEHASHHDDHEDEHHDDHANHDHGDVDPHAWHSIKNVKVYVHNIAKGLIQIDPKHKADYQQNAKDYIQKLDKLELKLNAQLASIPEAQRKVITPHDAFGYFARDFKVSFLSPQGMSTEHEVNAKDIAVLIKQIRHDKVKAVFMENIADNRLIEQISRETGANIGGELYSGALSTADKPAATYLQMMQHNVDTIVNALKQ